MILERVRRLVDNMFSLADSGDRQANEYLLNRVLGKPVEAGQDDTKGEAELHVDLGPPQDDPAHNPDPPAAGVLG
jgi:hypothetical protein